VYSNEQTFALLVSFHTILYSITLYLPYRYLHNNYNSIKVFWILQHTLKKDLVYWSTTLILDQGLSWERPSGLISGPTCTVKNLKTSIYAYLEWKEALLYENLTASSFFWDWRYFQLPSIGTDLISIVEWAAFSLSESTAKQHFQNSMCNANYGSQYK